MGLVSGEVENGAADDDVGGVIWKLLDSTASARKFETGSRGAICSASNCTVRIAFGSGSIASTWSAWRRKKTRLRPLPQPASSTLIPGTIRPERLIEEVDVDLTEDRGKVNHGAIVGSSQDPARVMARTGLCLSVSRVLEQPAHARISQSVDADGKRRQATPLQKHRLRCHTEKRADVLAR